MPNGGSDCCGTCWFNRRNQGEVGYEHVDSSAPPYCEIRGLQVEDPFWTYCVNHPHRSPDGDRIPIGPVFHGHAREVWKLSPDTTVVREHLLALLSQIDEQPSREYPAEPYKDEVVVWQLGEFTEEKAIAGLERIVSFNPEATTGAPLNRTRRSLVRTAEEALEKIRSKS